MDFLGNIQKSDVEEDILVCICGSDDFTMLMKRLVELCLKVRCCLKGLSVNAMRCSSLSRELTAGRSSFGSNWFQTRVRNHLLLWFWGYKFYKKLEVRALS